MYVIKLRDTHLRGVVCNIVAVRRNVEFQLINVETFQKIAMYRCDVDAFDFEPSFKGVVQYFYVGKMFETFPNSS